MIDSHEYNINISNDILKNIKCQKEEINIFKKLLDKNDIFEIHFGLTKEIKASNMSFNTIKFIEILGKDNLEKITLIHSSTMTDDDIILFSMRIMTFLCLLGKKVFIGHSSTPFLMNFD